MNSLGPQKDFSALLEERDFLRGRLGELSTERENCLRDEGKNLEAEYYDKIGFLEVECLTLEMDCARLKREIEFITAAQNRGGAWDYEEITSALDREFEAWQQRVTAESAKLEAARERLSSLMAPQDAALFQKLYRQLVKELHPDIHPTRHPRLRPLWDRLQRGYANGDMAELELLEILLKDEEVESPPSSLEILQQEIAALKAQSQSLVEALFTLRQSHPFTLAALLDDPAAIKEKKSSLRTKRDSLTARKTALSAALNQLLDGHPL